MPVFFLLMSTVKRDCPEVVGTYSSVGNIQIIYQDSISDKAGFISKCNSGGPASRSTRRKQCYVFYDLLFDVYLFLSWFLIG